MYDIYLGTSCDILPELSDMKQEISLLADITFQSRVLEKSCSPGVLGLELSEDLIKRLLERFKRAGAEGYYFSTHYYRPRISIEQAMVIAKEAIEKKRLQIVPTDTLGPLFKFGDEPLYWTFGSVSEQLMKEGQLPGVLFASIDKLDGHIWEFEEKFRLWENE